MAEILRRIIAPSKGKMKAPYRTGLLNGMPQPDIYRVPMRRPDYLIIAVRTVPTTPERIMTGIYRNYTTSLLADPANTGNVYVGEDEGSCTYPLDAGDVQITKADLGALWWKSDNGTEKVHIWAEREEMIIKRPLMTRAK